MFLSDTLGKPVETLEEVASFCARHNLHLIMDEIYAQSVFENPYAPNATPFTSILSIDLDGVIDSNLVHVMYGISKDFCANGARLGILASRNEGLLGAVAGLRYVDPKHANAAFFPVNVLNCQCSR